LNANTANMWYGFYNHLSGTKGGANSTMIWGCQYDQVIKFIGSQAQSGHLDRYLWSSTTAGTTSGYEPEGNTKPLDIMKNIYDLEGNCFEWTAQANSTSYRVYRGGSYHVVAVGRFYPASYRSRNLPNSTNAYQSSRPALYL